MLPNHGSVRNSVINESFEILWKLTNTSPTPAGIFVQLLAILELSSSSLILTLLLVSSYLRFQFVVLCQFQRYRFLRMQRIILEVPPQKKVGKQWPICSSLSYVTTLSFLLLSFWLRGYIIKQKPPNKISSKHMKKPCINNQYLKVVYHFSQTPSPTIAEGNMQFLG